ncbi:MAG: ABC transporter permease [Clostridium sp.]
MNFIKRAILSSRARIGKTIILFAVIVTVCVVVLTSFGIKSATEQASILARQKLGAEVTLSADMNKIRETMMNSNTNPGERVKVSQVLVPLNYLEELKDSEYVESYLISTTSISSIEGVDPVGKEEETTTTTQGKFPAGMGGPVRGDFSLVGVNDLSVSNEVKAGTVEILEGRAITEEDNNSLFAVIEETLSEESGLGVGDKIKVYNPADTATALELDIVGIYKNSSEFTEHAFSNTANSPYNQIFVPYKVPMTLKGESEATGVERIVFNINDPINVEKFVEEGKNTSIDFNTYMLDANNMAYEKMTGPIDNVASFSNTALISVTIFGGVILALIIMLSIKDRIGEIGILLSLGEGKIKIVGQFLAEMIIILVIAIGVSTMAGGTISNTISDKLLKNEIEVSENQKEVDMNRGGMGGPGMGGNKFNMQNSNVDTIDSLNVEINMDEILEMISIAALVTILGTIIPCVFIMRMHPKTILSKHN